MFALPHDVLALILCDYLGGGKEAACVCRSWRLVCGPYVFQHLVVKPTDMVDTAQAFLSHPILLGRTEDVTFCGIVGVSAADFRLATTIVLGLLQRKRLRRFTLLRCTEPEAMSFHPSFVPAFKMASFIESAMPLAVIAGLIPNKWEELYFCESTWPTRCKTLKGTAHQIRARSLWIEPFVEFCDGADTGGLRHVALRLMRNADCLTLVDPNLSLTDSSDSESLSAIVGCRLSHLCIASTCCFNHEEHVTPFNWNGFGLRSMTQLTDLWLVLGSDDLEAMATIMADGLPLSLLELRIEVHPERWDLEQVRALWQEVAQRMDSRPFSFSVCLCRFAGRAVDIDGGSGQAYVDDDGRSKIASAEDEWRRHGVEATFVRTEQTIQGFSHVLGKRSQQDTLSCMVCAGGHCEV
ncbi:hypothetical protein CYLTODRAFT_427571 [Cylindrobasidium torrendii FP15055 ss-10]|uniref:F-box domain-containing protein n=1 Tax=Cylindrobasidium torrendii FP15055 ss-10 TaxID=1314674 RepID=A0A0D7ATN1_9AGAR|nr:hypothetical protein CYLTODRAFT_427571 [Cylindrobasidium torrendii FP15055 ss-10]